MLTLSQQFDPKFPILGYRWMRNDVHVNSKPNTTMLVASHQIHKCEQLAHDDNEAEESKKDKYTKTAYMSEFHKSFVE